MEHIALPLFILLSIAAIALLTKRAQRNKDNADHAFDHRRVGKTDKDTHKPFFL